MLEGAWAIGTDIITATTDDVPYEEALHIALHTPGGNTEHLTLGAAYTTGVFRLTQATGTTLTFAFFGDTYWRVTVLNTPAFRLPLWRDPKGVSRPLRLRSRLRVETCRQPQ